MRQLEHLAQCAVVQWWGYAHKAYALPEFALFAVPNGGLRHRAIAGKLKAEGLRPGIPDLLLPLALGRYHGLAIEMKSEKGRTTDAQNIVIPWFASAAWRVEICRSSAEAIGALEDYLRELKGAKGAIVSA